MHHIGQKIAKAMVIATKISNFVEVYRHVLFSYPLQKICLREGINIIAPESVDLWNHFNDIWLYRTYTSGGYDIKHGSIVVDVGANIGLFSLFAARYAEKVYSFEPYPPVFDYLVRNTSGNRISNVDCFNYAIGAGSGLRTIYLDPSTTGSSFYPPISRPASNLEKTQVECKTLQEALDAVGIDWCDFLKLDCEGSEFEITFSTPRDYLLARIGVISIECHDELTEYTHVDLQRYLETIGFAAEVTIVRGNTAILKARNVTKYPVMP